MRCANHGRAFNHGEGQRDLAHITVYSTDLVCRQVLAPANKGRLNMRKFILVAAFVLASATAQAGGTRGLALASGDEPAAAEQPKAIEAPPPAEVPKSVSRPA